MTSRQTLAEPLLEPLWSAEQARRADAYTIEDLGVPGIVLMEHAGRAVAERVRARGARTAIVFAGPGNNGGDGWVAARHLWGAGVPCPVVTLKAPDQLTGDASLAAQMFLTAAEARGWNCPPFGGPFFLVDLADDVRGMIDVCAPDIIVDALFGTGLSRAVEGVAERVIVALAQIAKPIVAVDVPSGLPTDGEAPAGPCIHATETVTFAGKKIAHASEPGKKLCGEVHVVDIGLLHPPGTTPSAYDVRDTRGLLPTEDALAHKGRYGHVAIVEGASGTDGAARLACRSALRAGAGLVTLLLRPRTSEPEARVDDEVMRLAVQQESDLDRFGAFIVGPGIGSESSNTERALRVLHHAAERHAPVVVDAEALSLTLPAALLGVATPHPGEAARVLGTSSESVQRDRIGAIRALRDKLPRGVVIVLKGACPLVLDDRGTPLVVPGGTPALAVAGSGDVLAGAIGGLLARGLSPRDAALLAVSAHQRAGAALGSRGHLASDIADALAAELRRPSGAP